MMTLVPTLLLLTAATGARGQVSAATNLVAATPPVRVTRAHKPQLPGTEA
jgi:hypothetical protein